MMRVRGMRVRGDAGQGDAGQEDAGQEDAGQDPYCCYVLCLGGDECGGSVLAEWRHAWGEEGCAIPLRCTSEDMLYPRPIGVCAMAARGLRTVAPRGVPSGSTNASHWCSGIESGWQRAQRAENDASLLFLTLEGPLVW